MELEGTLISDRYLLEKQIGEGGMGSVWRATDKTLQRLVAVKVLYSGDERDRELRVSRFLREARIAAAVQHRNVVHIVDFGSTPEGRPYMVMEHLRGETLADRLARSPAPSVGDVVEVVASTLAGLAAAHEAGIVHRDMKPENIFLVDDADGPFPKILDFGISRSLQPESGPRSALTTRSGFLVGTPQYMSPEQARGIDTIDHRTDLFSVGVILYEALTGRLPVESDHIGDLIILIAAGGAPTATEVRPELGDALSEVVRKAMSVMVDARYDDARAMRTALLDARDRTSADALALPAKSRRRRSGLPPKPAETADTIGAKGATEAAAALAKTLPARRAPTADVAPPAHSVETPKAWTVSEPREPEGRNRAMLVAIAAAVALAAGAFVWSSRGDGADADGPREPGGGTTARQAASRTPTPLDPDPIPLAPDAGFAVVSAEAADAGFVVSSPVLPEDPTPVARDPSGATRGSSAMRETRARPTMTKAPPTTLRDLDY